MSDWREAFYEDVKNYFNSQKYGITQRYPIDKVVDIVESYDNGYGCCGSGDFETKIVYLSKNGRVHRSVFYYGSLASLMEEL